jgi:hypothetical protein
VSDLVDGVVVVREEEIIAAMKLVFERMKVRRRKKTERRLKQAEACTCWYALIIRFVCS